MKGYLKADAELCHKKMRGLNATPELNELLDLHITSATKETKLNFILVGTPIRIFPNLLLVSLKIMAYSINRVALV